MDLSSASPSGYPLILQLMSSSSQKSSGAFTICHLDECKYLLMLRGPGMICTYIQNFKKTPFPGASLNVKDGKGTGGQREERSLLVYIKGRSHS